MKCANPPSVVADPLYISHGALLILITTQHSELRGDHMTFNNSTN